LILGLHSTGTPNEHVIDEYTGLDGQYTC